MFRLDVELSLEQSLSIRNIEDAAKHLSKNELAEYLVKVSRLYLMEKNVTRSLINHIMELEHEQLTKSTNDTTTPQ